MTEYVKFSDEAVEAALQSAQSSESLFESRSINGTPVADITYTLRAECVEVNVTDKGVCVGLPLGLKDVCLQIPVGIDIGTVAKACLDIYYKEKFGIKLPAGVEVTVYVAGQKIVQVKYGL